MRFRSVLALFLILLLCVSCGEKPIENVQTADETTSEAAPEEKKPESLRVVGWLDAVTESAVYAYNEKHPKARIKDESAKSPEEMAKKVAFFLKAYPGHQMKSAFDG